MPLPKGPPSWLVGSDTTLGKISSSPPCSATSPGTCSALRKRLLGLWRLLSSKTIQRAGRGEGTAGKEKEAWGGVIPFLCRLRPAGRGREAEGGVVSGEGPSSRYGFLKIGFHYCQFRPQNMPNSLLCFLPNSFFFITEYILQGFFQWCLWEMNSVFLWDLLSHTHK